MNYIPNDTIKDCRRNFYLSFEYTSVYDNSFINMENIEEGVLPITLECKKIKFQFSVLGKKIKKARKCFFKFSEIVKLIRKIDSSLSNIHICYCLKLPKP